MSSNTTSIKNTFDGLYSALRRKYSQYVKNYNASQYFVFGNIQLKQAYSIPYWNGPAAAFQGSNPDGYLPMDLSPYYLRERPILFNRPDDQFMADYFSSGVFNTAYYPPVLLLNIYVNGAYRDVYVPYDPRVMDVVFYIAPADFFASQQDIILSLHTILNKNLKGLATAYNQCTLLLANSRYQDSDNFVANYKRYVETTITRYQANLSYVVKVCKSCGNALLPNGTSLPDLMVIGGAPSLTWLCSKLATNYNDVYSMEQSIYDNSQPDWQELQSRYKTLSVNSPQPDLTAITKDGVTTLPGAVVTAAKKYWWVIALGVGLSFVFSDKRKIK